MNRIAELFRGRAQQKALPHLHDSKPGFTAPPSPLPARDLQLDIFVGGRCPICQSALAGLQNLRRELPNVHINVIDLDAPNTPKPDNIIAIPSFVINGYLIATGNLKVDELKKFIGSLN